MIILLKLGAIISCLWIARQDFASRSVTWILFPLLALFLGGLHYLQSEFTSFWLATGFNLGLIFLILLVLWGYSRYILGVGFLNKSFGLGDVLLLIALALGFPTYSFIILLASSILFSCLVYFLVLKRKEEPSVPLAGLIGLFIATMLPVEGILPGISLYLY